MTLSTSAAARLAPAIFLISGCRSLEQPPVRVFPAPAGALEALENRYGEGRPHRVWAEVLDWGGESALYFGIDDQVFLKEAYFSEDANHGWGISAFHWSPAGPYAACQVYSSGGHQPYHAPVLVADLETPEILEMDSLVDALFKDRGCGATEDAREIHWSLDGKLHFYTICDGGQVFYEIAYDPGTRSLEQIGNLKE